MINIDACLKQLSRKILKSLIGVYFYLNSNDTSFPSMYAFSIGLLVEDLQRQVHDNKLISGSVIDIILYYWSFSCANEVRLITSFFDWCSRIVFKYRFNPMTINKYQRKLNI